LEKETIVKVDVGDKAGEFTIELSEIKNQNGKLVIPKASEEFLVGTKMQRMVQEVNNTGTVGIYDGSLLINMFDEDMSTCSQWAGYSCNFEIKFKKSERIKKITIWTGVYPTSPYNVKVQGLQGSTWSEIGNFTGTFPGTEGEWKQVAEMAVTEDIYDAIKFDISTPNSWTAVSELVVD